MPKIEQPVLHDKTSIFSTPHRYLRRLRVYFTLPSELTATALGGDNTNFPPNWWIENWDKTGLFWRISPRNAAPFEMCLLIEHCGRNRKIFGAKEFTTDRGYYGFHAVPAYEESKDSKDDSLDIYSVIHIPKDINSKYDILCSFSYNKHNKASIERHILKILKSMYFKK